jgi:DNA topoisomerase-2
MKIVRYTTPQQIADEFFPVRLNLYRDRKSVLECSLEFDAALARNRARFIETVSAEKIDLLRGRKSKDATVAQLEEMKFSKLSELNTIKLNNCSTRDKESNKGSINEYDYLLNMSLSSLTLEKIEALKDEASKTDEKLKKIQNTTAEDLWIEDLDKLEPHL